MCKIIGMPTGEMLTDFNLYSVLHRLQTNYKGFMLIKSNNVLNDLKYKLITKYSLINSFIESKLIGN